MSLRIAEKAVSIYKKKHSKPYHIRLFGGEPLLRFGLIKEIVNNEDSFYLSTNGSLFNSDIISFLKDHPNINIAISNLRDFDLLKQLPRIIANICVAPEQSEDFVGRVAHLLVKGVRRFNFLPTFFVSWNQEQLDSLAQAFDLIVDLIKEWEEVEVLNRNAYNKTPLFNHGMIVDTDGSIFSSNAFLCKSFEHLREEFVLGNVNLGEIKEIAIDWPKIFYENLSLIEYDSTLQVNEILLDFIDSLGR